ncbi:universal stress protein [Modestobacter sp. NPDC049651]|uniref:universal stress protein n=1 Tax=unclassified Modestobacter TaxID=2643866 RepID=UPI0033E0CCCA
MTDAPGTGEPRTSGTPGFERGTDGPRVIVVGFDGTPPSLRAGAYAAGLARRQRARLVVAHVAATPAAAMLAPSQPWPLEETLSEIADDLRKQVEAEAEVIGIRAEFVVRRGDPFQELTRLCGELLADAVVVGASASAGHRITGSLAVRLVRCGRWPVTVVP